MSRGGFRGRGGGRGGMPTPAGMSHEAYREIMAAPVQHVGMLYPLISQPLNSESVSFLAPPSSFEDVMIKKETELEDTLRKGVVIDEVEGTRWCGWRLPEVRKTVGIEIETYSDLFARPSQATPQAAQLDPVKLKLDERFFPPSLWNTYFAPEEENKRQAKTKNGQSRKRKILDSDGEERTDDEEAEKSSNASSAEEDAEYEDESDHQDYDANYFDNGEGDDDEGGEDEDGGGGNFDD